MHEDSPIRYPTLQYALTLADYRHSVRHYNRKRSALLLIFYFALFNGSAFASGADRSEWAYVLLLGLIVCVVIAILIGLGQSMRITRQYRSNPLIRQNQSIECGPAGLRIITESSDLTIRWKELREAVESPKAFTLFTAAYHALIIPKKLVEEREFRMMLRRHMPPGKLRLSMQR